MPKLEMSRIRKSTLRHDGVPVKCVLNPQGTCISYYHELRPLGTCMATVRWSDRYQNWTLRHDDNPYLNITRTEWYLMDDDVIFFTEPVADDGEEDEEE